MAKTWPFASGVPPIALHAVPFHFAIRSAFGSPPASVKLPPTYRTPGLSVLRAVTVPFSDAVVDVPPLPTRLQPPGPTAQAGAARATIKMKAAAHASADRRMAASPKSPGVKPSTRRDESSD